MSDEQDAGDRTEQPTPKKLRDARERGDVSRSREIGSTVGLLVFTLVAGLLAWALGLHGVTAQTVVALAALPCVAPRFSVGATQETALPVLNAAATATTLLWVVTLPLALWILT